MRYEIFVTVWGERFVRKFCDFALASQLSPGNLPALAKDAEVIYRIYTDRESRQYFNDAMPALEATGVAAELIFYEEMTYKGAALSDVIAASDPTIVKHNVQRETAQDHVRLAAATPGTAAMLFDSDFIFADGSLAYIDAQRRAGKKAVAGIYLRLEEEGASPELAKMPADGWLARTLVQLGLEHMHPIQRSMFMGAESFSPYPAQLNWMVEAGGRKVGYITHCFFPHPLMIELDGGAFSYMSTMDYEVTLRAAADEDICFVNSSDDLLFCKLSTGGYLADRGAAEPPSLETMARFILSNTNVRHRLFMETPVRFIADDGSGIAGMTFDTVACASSAFVSEIYQSVELTLANQSGIDPKSMMFIKSYLGPIENFISPQVNARMDNWM
ncbi:MAG: hypothetical protein VW169_14360 [Rhodospirillaceae bacterium]